MTGCLHILDPDLARRTIRSMVERNDPHLADLAAGNERAANRLTAELAQAMADAHPTFAWPGIDLTSWEAQVDRGIGMLLRPPARLFVDAGVARSQVLTMPIRIDPQGEMMAGAWVPPESIPALADHLDTHLERCARRLHDADRDPYPLLALILDAVSYARERGFGLIESADVIGPGSVIVEPPARKHLPKDIRQRIDAALQEDRKPGLFGRLFRRE